MGLLAKTPALGVVRRGKLEYILELSQGQQYVTVPSGICKQAALRVLGGLKCKNLGSACLPKLPLLGWKGLSWSTYANGVKDNKHKNSDHGPLQAPPGPYKGIQGTATLGTW
jgi:hypothetical protein